LIKKLLAVISLLIVSLLVISSVQKQLNTPNLDDPVLHDFKALKFPYMASDQRQEDIKSNSHKLKLGMLDHQVQSILGKPDKVYPLYKTIKNGKPIGKSYFYILNQDKLEGSMNDKNERSITIRFNHDQQLIAASGTRASFFQDIKANKH
jgi:hypothetical protein